MKAPDAREIEEITKAHPMEYLCNHPFFMIRWIERARRELLLKTIAPKTGEIIADIGCERGHLLSMIHKKCPQVKKLIGADLSNHALIEAKRLAVWERWDATSEFLLCDARNVSLPDNSVDVAISSNVLEHLPDPEQGFAELCRITKPGGRIILNLPNEKRIVSLKKFFFKIKINKVLDNLKLVTPGHLHYPDKKFVRELCSGKAIIQQLFLGPAISLAGLYVYAVVVPLKPSLKQETKQ